MYSLIVQHIELITGEIMSCFTSPAIMEMLGHYRWRVYEPFRFYLSKDKNDVLRVARSGWYAWLRRRHQMSLRQQFRLTCDATVHGIP